MWMIIPMWEAGRRGCSENKRFLDLGLEVIWSCTLSVERVETAQYGVPIVCYRSNEFGVQ